MNNLISPIDNDLDRKFSEDEIAERKAEWIDQRSDEIAKEILSVDEFKFKGAIYDSSDVTESIYLNESEGESFDELCRKIAVSPVIWIKPCTEGIKTLMLKHAKKIAVDLAEQEFMNNSNE